MSLTRKDDTAWPNEHTFTRLKKQRLSSVTPESLYDRVSKVFTNVAIMKMGDTWVFGRLVPLSEVGPDECVRRLGTHAVSVIVESTDWTEIVETVLQSLEKKVQT